MTETTQTDEELWALWHPDQKIPGSPAPVEGKCGAQIKSKDVRDLGLIRYCTKRAGMGTSHLDTGKCKLHGGNSHTHIVKATREIARREITTLAELAGEPAPLGPPEVEYLRVAAEARQFREVIKDKIIELQNMVTIDKAGVEHVSAMIELFERASDRFEKMLQFMLRFDLDKRIQALEEQQVNLIVAGFMSVILNVDLGLSQAQVDRLRADFALKMSELGDNIAPTWTNVIDVEAVDAEWADAEIVDED